MSNNTDTITREDAIEEYLLTQGASKVSAIANALSMSDTTTRKVLNQLVDSGHVVKDGQLFSWKKKAAKKAAGNSNKREAVAKRDALVLNIITKYASQADQSISREKVMEKLIAKNHIVSGSFVYLSIFRLHQAGEIERVHVGKRYPEWRIAAAKKN